MLFLLSLFLASISMAEQVTVSFQPKNDSDKIDSVHVTNLTRGQMVKLAPGEPVVFNLVTSTEHLVLDDAENGYLYPNPSSRFTTLTFNTGKSEKVYLTIYDNQGKMLLRTEESLTPGTHSFRLSFPAPGLYHVALLKSEKLLSYKALHTEINQQGADIRYLGSEALATDENPENHLKSAQSGKSLDYFEGDVVHYTAFSGDNTTIIPDKPKTTKTIEVEFHECKDPDNRSYKIVQIGNQWWMAENLAYLPAVSPPEQPESHVLPDPYYYVYDYQGIDVNAAKATDNFKTYGVLYNWPAAMNGYGSSTANPSGVQGICPEGWHLPSNAELMQLKNYLAKNGYNYDGTIGGILSIFAKSMAATTLWRTSSKTGAIGNDLSVNNSSGFSALPGGIRYPKWGTFEVVGDNCYFWTSSEEFGGALIFSLSYNYANISFLGYPKVFGYSVRCVRGSVESPSIPSIKTGEVSDITQTSATIYGNITNDNGSKIISRGFYWSKTNEEPGESDYVEVVEGSLGEYSQNITGLQPKTTYYYRAFATNGEGTSTGSVKSFLTCEEPGSTVEWKRDTLTAVVDVTNPVTGKTWMDRNLGASRAATGSTDAEAYGDLYQWGRAADGHQKRDSEITSTLSSSDTPDHGKFIFTSSGANNGDWRNSQCAILWQGVNGLNNPCPDGYRLPTEAELEAERASWSSNNSAGAFGSPLKLPAAGYRSNNSIYGVGSYGGYWSDTMDGSLSRRLAFHSSSAGIDRNTRGNGASVRCIKED